MHSRYKETCYEAVERLEARVKRLESALSECALVLAGNTMTTKSIINALESARAALEDK